MAIYFLGCDEHLVLQIKKFPQFSGSTIEEIEFPITTTTLKIDLLIIGPKVINLIRLAATVSDWNIPPATLFILESHQYDNEAECLNHHPRVGRSIFFCSNTTESVSEGLKSTFNFFQKRNTLELDNTVSGDFNINNISPRWLFQTMMEHLDEYIYFKDQDSRFLAVSKYLVESCGKSHPDEILGLRDFDIFDETHAKDAYKDEQKIATGELNELSKEERILKGDKHAWVVSRKLPFYTRSNYLAGTFGLSREITKEKILHQELEKNNEKMHSELVMARNLQSTLMQQAAPVFQNEKGKDQLEIASKYIPSFHLSGDFYSIIKTAEGGLAILIADVMGHGVRAAMVTAMIQIAVQQLNEYASQPRTFMTKLNAMMQKTIQPSGQTLFTTAAYMYLDLDKKKLTYVQAGATHGVFVPSNENHKAELFEKSSISPALGLLEGTDYPETTMEMAAGDEIVLYTDGIIEAAMGDEEYSEKRLIKFLADHHRDHLDEMMESLLSSVQEFTHTEELEDDVCLITIRLT